jgi:cell division protein FtsL
VMKAKLRYGIALLVGRIRQFTIRRAALLKDAPIMAVVLSLAVLCVGLFFVWTRMQIVQVGYDISTLEVANKELKERKRELMVEIAAMQSPKELEKKARKHGLIIPDMTKVVHVP